jgi:hypothetical protein
MSGSLLSALLNSPDKIARRILPGTTPISMDCPPGSRATYHLDASDVLHVDLVDPCDESTFYVHVCNYC